MSKPSAEVLRAKIRSYEIMCRCSPEERGFRVVDGALQYGRGTTHRAGCQWADAVQEIYRQERALER